MNAILISDPKMPYFTDMRPIRDAFGDRWSEFDWVVTDIWATGYFSGAEVFDATYEDLLVTGPDLDALLDDGTYHQWIWAVFSGVPRGTPLYVPDVVPTAHSRHLWEPGSRPQHPDAAVEIVCWDSACTLLISRDEDLVKRFRLAFEQTMDLDEYVNRRA